jgi:hypothetical protein
MWISAADAVATRMGYRTSVPSLRLRGALSPLHHAMQLYDKVIISELSCFFTRGSASKPKLEKYKFRLQEAFLVNMPTAEGKEIILQLMFSQR